MKAQTIGYVRVSSQDQNPDRQLDGVETDRVFVDRASGGSADRPALEDMVGYAREGDSVVVHSMDRLARNLGDLRSIVSRLVGKGAKVSFLKEGLVFTGEDSPMSRFLLNVLGAVAEFERALIRERQMEGIALAKKRGVYKGRTKSLSPERAGELARRAAAGESRAKLAREFGVSRGTVYRYIKEKKQ